MWWEPRLSSRVGTGILGPLELHEGSPASFRVLRGNSGLLSRHCQRKGPHLALTRESHGLSRVEAGGLGFLSRYHGEIREPLVLPQESQVSIRVARVSLGVLWSQGRGIRPHFTWTGESPCVSRVAAGSVGSLKLPWGPEGASHVVSGKSGIHMCCEGPLGIPLELSRGLGPHLNLRREMQGSSPALTGFSGLLWRFHLGVRRHLLLGHGTPLPSRGVKGVSGLPWS